MFDLVLGLVMTTMKLFSQDVNHESLVENLTNIFSKAITELVFC